MLKQAPDLYSCTHDQQKERLTIDLNKCAEASSPPLQLVDFDPVHSKPELISPRHDSHAESSLQTATPACVLPYGPLCPPFLFPPTPHENLFFMFPFFSCWEQVLVHQSSLAKKQDLPNGNISMSTPSPDLKEEIKEDVVDDRRSLLAKDYKHQINDLCLTKSPSWLPDGWITEIRTRKTGSTAGIRRKVFKHLASGRRFRTQKEVLHFLQTGKGRASKKCLPNAVISERPEGNHGLSQCTSIGMGELTSRQFQPCLIQFHANQNRLDASLSFYEQLEAPVLRENNFSQEATEVVVKMEEPVEMDLCDPWKAVQVALDDKMVALEMDTARSHAEQGIERSGNLRGWLESSIKLGYQTRMGYSQHRSSQETGADLMKSMLPQIPILQTPATSLEHAQEGNQQEARCLGPGHGSATDLSMIVTPKERFVRNKDLHFSLLDSELDLGGLDPGLSSRQRTKHIQKMKAKHAKGLLASLGRKLCLQAIHESAMDSKCK